jgi:hypothetical protein
MKGSSPSWPTYDPLVPDNRSPFEQSHRNEFNQTAVVHARERADSVESDETMLHKTAAADSPHETPSSMGALLNYQDNDTLNEHSFSKDTRQRLQEEKLSQHLKSLTEYNQFEMTAASADNILDAFGSQHQRDYTIQSNSSWLSSIVNSVASIFGAGYVGIPYALSLAGLPFGILLLIVMGVISGK